MWNREPHLAGDTGLSRYYDFGEGPPAEALQDETGIYRKVAAYFFFHPAQADHYIVENLPGATEPVAGAAYTEQVCEVPLAMARAECEQRREFKLSSDYYKGDRSMRESGFDVSFRFGPFGAATHHFAPVCLNSLLYKTEKDLEQISAALGRKEESEKWRQQAAQRNANIQRYLWDDEAGFFFDFDGKTGHRSSYEYVTTFYPLWAGIASPEQAKAVARSVKVFEQPGGLATSPNETGGQWDYPYGWAPLQLLAV